MKKIIVTALFFTVYAAISQDPLPPDQNQANQDIARQHQLNSEETQERNNTDFQNIEEGNAYMTEGLGRLNSLLNTMNSAHDLYSATLALDNNECTPDLNVEGNAMMPTRCRPGDPCTECYTHAYNELKFIRRQLARLHCIYSNTRNFNEKAIAFGDNVSGVHAINGLAWQSAKAEIVGAYESFKHTYDNKYAGMMQSLHNALMSIDGCEKQYGDEGWYARAGFIYFELMKEKYKRTD
jgi:hypothetical protein